MRGVVLRQKGPEPVLAVEILPMPQLSKGEILVRVQYAAVTSHDLALIQGARESLRPIPFSPGYVGSGVVVACGDPLHRWRFVGKRVAFLALGAWAEYTVTPSDSCFILSDLISSEQAVSLFFTPLTITMFEELLDALKSTGVIQTAGVPDISCAFLRICNYRKLPCVSVVSSMQVADRLFELGARYLILDTDPKFKEKIAILAQEVTADCAFDSCGGEVAGAVLTALGEGGTLYCYEVAYNSTVISEIQPQALIFQKKRMIGVDVLAWWNRKTALQKMSIISHIQKYYFMYRTDVLQSFPIGDLRAAMAWTGERPGDGIAVLRMDRFPDRLGEEEKTGEVEQIGEVELSLLQKSPPEDQSSP